ncbi:solute carrier family 23 member 2-like [Xenia sp. Carnegie-2017]|uniref:solute carrier family 23 member 2-like n=1 Tax=Xenia sp. Carnegie-2017 TaxID=2897299 RepID=UPI001F037D06|nr:solute carrier family 23 member 2-like [Xenia sp. Carnegie-2017]
MMTKDKRKQESKTSDVDTITLNYRIDETPPWYLALFLGFQHYLTMFGATLAVPIIIAPALCVTDDVVVGKLISTIFFVSGIATLLQTTFGNRLPIVQGTTFSYLVPTFALLSLPKFQCPPGLKDTNNTENSTSNSDEIWQIRMREVQGAIMVSSLFQIFIGFTGLIGFLLRFIGPITIAPTIALVGLALFPVCSDYAAKHWGIAIITIAVITICSQFLSRVKIPLPTYSRLRGFHTTGVAIFGLFPVVIAIIVSWIFCAIFTETDVFSATSKARTDSRSSVLSQSPWFRVPYPGQWGTPTISLAGVFGMFAGVIAGVIESIGDYYACARLSGAPPPPPHAINRGIGVEGVACLLAGAIGTGNATTSFSENIGALGITKVGSRRVVQCGAILMIILALFGKFGALFSTIPDPVIGGVFCVMFGLITAVGISNLQFVDLNSVRNLFIIGFAIVMGLVIPDYLNKNAGVINTGVDELDQIFTVLLKTSMAVGGTIACLLDNLIPGTVEERGIKEWRKLTADRATSNVASIHVYDLPFGIFNKSKFSKFIPFLPYYDDETEIFNMAERS